ncbi:MAG: FAD-dependent oxidoreductase [Chloroflexi bacterium]|nr:FAD-dependent oxidoreductase [Chloroflexota bacterium]
MKVIETQATSQTVWDGKFDAVILATGGVLNVPDVPGIERPSVVSALNVLRGTGTGGNVVVVGGGLAGCDVALLLAEQGKRVVIVEMKDSIAQDLNTSLRVALFERLARRDVQIYTGVHLAEVTDSGIVVHDKYSVKPG